MKTLIYLYKNIEKIISQIIFVLLTVIVFMQTVLRYLFHATLPWPEEVCSILLLWLIYMTIGYAVTKKAHITVDSVLALYPKKMRKYVDLVAILIWLALSIFVTYHGTLVTIDTAAKGARAASLPWLKMWVAYITIPLGYGLMSIRLVEQLIAQIKEIRTGVENAPEEAEDELGGGV